MRYLIPVVLTLVALTGCAAPPPAREVPPARIVTPPPRPTPAPPPLASDWNDWPFTPGDWTYSRNGFGSAARFANGLFTFECGNDRRVHIETAMPVAGPLLIRTTSLSRSLTLRFLGDPPAGSVTDLSPNDPLLDAIAFSRGRFVIERSGAAPLVLPPHAEIGRVIEDCRG